MSIIHTRKRKLTVALAGALVLATFVPALALAGPLGLGSLSSAPGTFLERIFDRLELTPEQREEIRAVVASHHDELRGELTDLIDARLVLHDQVHAETFDEDAIRQAASVVAAAQAELAVTHGVLVQEVREILTPEQEAEAREMHETVHNLVGTLRTLVGAHFGGTMFPR